jgi:GxxExxY protein
LIRELSFRGIKAEPQVCFAVSYKGKCIGEYLADIVVEGELVVELKCVDRLASEIWRSASTI